MIFTKTRTPKYGFVENEDFTCYWEISQTQTRTGRKGKAKIKKYLFTLDMAKELSMVENNEQGRMARRYFINCEKVLRKTVFGLMNQFNKASLEFDKFCDIASHAGRTLNLVGKQYKPQAKQRVDDLKKQIQPMFPNLGEPKDV
ncbi:antA/AntB antirepressor family protein [Acinetobacter ursingii]|uniref:antA/AntB antirepressor family protein n=1 Tax=Acinetobacter ursingii TaxID=108980 RepID=UPI001D17D502|nr:antA/AntB antirepressor family protein [Acinetobacter ursingii]